MNQYVSQGVFDRRVKLIEEKLKNIYDNDLLNRLQAEQEEFIKRLKEIELDGSIPDYFIADYNAFKANTLRIDDVYDANGQFDGSKIKPLSISTAALTVGQRSQQLSLTGVEFSVTPYSHSGGYYGTLGWSGGSMFHYGFINENSEPKVYTITSGSFALGNSAYYIYAYIANLESTTTTAEIKVSTNQIKVDGEGKPNDFPNGYYVQLGYVSVELDSGSSESSNRYYRKVDTTYGQTTINGRLITTGRIEGSSGANYVYFDLDKGEIGGTIKFTSGNEKLDIDDYLETKYTDIYSYVFNGEGNPNEGIKDYVDSIKSDLEDQIDGRIDTWFGNVQPGPNVYPENEWTTTSDKDNHLGDLYYDDSTGYAYRYTKNGNNYTWNKIEDTDMTRALAIAKSAKETADGKMSVFLDDPSNPPIPPYSEGDMWVNATYPKTGTKIYNDETLVCIDRHFESCTNASYSQSTIYYKIENNEYVVDDEVTSENFNTKKSSLYKQIFNIADWQSSNRAIAEVDNVTNDGIISKGSEKASLKKEFEEITGTYNKALAAINTFDVGSNVTTQKTALDNAYNALLAKMKVILGTNTQGNIDDSRINEDTEIESAIAPGLNMTKQAFRDLWTTYYSAEATLNDAIQKAAQDKIEAGVDAAKAELLAINNGTTTIAGGMITNNLLELKNIVGVSKQFKNYVSGRQYYKRISNVTSGGSTVARFLTVSTGSTYPNYNLYEEAEQGDINTISGIAVSSESQTTGTSKIFKETKFYYGGGTPGFVTAGLSGIEDFPCYWSGGDEVLARNYINFKKAWDAAPSPYNASLEDYEWDKSNKDFIYDYDEVEPDHNGHPNKTFPVWKKESTNPVKHIKANFITALSRYEKYIRNATKYAGANSDWTTIDSSSDIPRLPVVIIDSKGFCKFGDFYIYESQVYYNNASGFGHYALTLNGQQNGSGTSLGSFYAPTSAGTNGYILKSNGSGAPEWVNQSSLSVGSATALGSYFTSRLITAIPYTTSSTTGWKRICKVSNNGLRYQNFFIMFSGSWFYYSPTNALLHVSVVDSRISVSQIGACCNLGQIRSIRFVYISANTFWLDIYNVASGNEEGNQQIEIFGDVSVTDIQNPPIVITDTVTPSALIDIQAVSGNSLTTSNSYVSSGKGYINSTEITTITGNAATATKATQDGNGNTITSTYLPLSGGTMTGTINSQSILPKTTHTYDIGNESYNFIYGCFNVLYPGTGNNLWLNSNATSGSTTGIVFGYGGKTASTTLGKWTYTGLGIGTDSPAYKLSVEGGVCDINKNNNTPTDVNGLNNVAATFRRGIANSDAWCTSIGLLAYNNQGAYISAGGYGFTISTYYNSIWTDVLSIVSGNGTDKGNVGIGTTSPAYKLDVSGDAFIGNTSATSHTLSLQSSASQLRMYAYSDGNCYIEAGNSAFSGNSTSGILYLSGYNNNNLNNIELKATTTHCSNDFYATGGVTALSSVSSDKRLKKNIKSFNAIEIVDKLKPVQFEWNNKAKKYNSNFKDGKNYGLIAQDSDNIIDNLVFDLPDGKGYKGVRYEKLIPILLQAIKEQQKEIDELKSIVKQLKNK